jgi:hypothetical protein
MRNRIGLAAAALIALVIGILILTRQPSHTSRAEDQLDLDLPGPAVIIPAPSPTLPQQR